METNYVLFEDEGFVWHYLAMYSILMHPDPLPRP